MTKEHVETMFYPYPDAPDQRFQVCVLAALDGTSQRDVSQLSYAKSLIDFHKITGRHPNGQPVHKVLREMTETIKRADNFNHAYLEYYQSRTSQSTQHLLDQARQRRDRIIVWTSPVHVVGVMPHSPTQWEFVGLGLPRQRIVDTEAVHQYIRTPEEPDIPNIVVIGPEIKGPHEEIPWKQTGDYKSLREARGIGSLFRGLKQIYFGY